MASGGGAPSSAPGFRSWARVVEGNDKASLQEELTVNTKETMEKLKGTVKRVVQVEEDYHLRSFERMKTALFGKFLGKSLALDRIKPILTLMWKHYGDFSIADLPNGFLYINCSSQEMVDHLLCDGPWSVAGMVLQLAPWKPNFQAAFEKLDTAAVWVQLHHLPIEYWQVEMLENIAGQFGRLIKIDDHTLNLTRAKFARLCIEIDLSKPLSQGFWIGGEEDKVLVLVMYERLPAFCYGCGRVGHVLSKCDQAPAEKSNEETTTQNNAPMMVDDAELQQDRRESSDMLTGKVVAPSSAAEFGSWLVPRYHRGRNSGRTSGAAPHRWTAKEPKDTWPNLDKGNRHLALEGAPPVPRAGKLLQEFNSGKHGDNRLHNSHPTAGFQRSPNPYAALGLDGVECIDGISNPSVGSKSLIRTIDDGGSPDLDAEDGTREDMQNKLPNVHLSPPKLLTSRETHSTMESYDQHGKLEEAQSSDHHEALVRRVSSALESNFGGKNQFDLDREHGLHLVEAHPREEDEEMTLAQFHNEAKLEALARRQNAKQATSSKKGRKSDSTT